MPLLSADDLERLKNARRHKCPSCKQDSVKDYCRQCDEFFIHCGCPPQEHVGHCTYEAIVLHDADMMIEEHGFLVHTQAARDWIDKNVYKPGMLGDVWVTSPITEEMKQEVITKMRDAGLKVS